MGSGKKLFDEWAGKEYSAAVLHIAEQGIALSCVRGLGRIGQDQDGV